MESTLFCNMFSCSFILIPAEQIQTKHLLYVIMENVAKSYFKVALLYVLNYKVLVYFNQNSLNTIFIVSPNEFPLGYYLHSTQMTFLMNKKKEIVTFKVNVK